jgi:hypothetical protein
VRRRVSAVLVAVAVVVMSFGISAPALADPPDGPYQVVGTVSGPDGQPVEGALINATSYGMAFQQSSDETDADGAYVITGLDEGDFRVWASVSPYRLFEQYSVEVGTTSPSPRVDIALKYPPVESASLTGVVKDSATNLAISGASVYLSFALEDGFYITKSVTTDSAGVYSIPAVAPTPAGTDASLMFSVGGGTAYYSKSLRVVLQVGANVRDTRLAPVVPGSGSISGTVTLSEPGAISTASVSLYPWGGTGSSIANDTVTFDGDGDGDGDGVGDYDLTGLQDGKYFINVYAPGTAFQSILVKVDSGASDGGDVVRPIDLIVYDSGDSVVSGTIVDDRLDAPVQGVNVSLSPFTGVKAPYGNTYTAADGSFSFGDLPDGQYGLSYYVWSLTPPAGTLGYTQTTAYLEVVIDDGEVVGGPLELAVTSVLPGDGVVQGRVRDAETYLPIAGVEVEVRFPGMGFETLTTETDATGRFQQGTLPDGDYYLTLSADGYLDGYGTVSVVDGGTTSVVMPLQPASGSTVGFDEGTLTVTVFDLDDEIVDDAYVSVWSEGSSQGWNGYTDAEGIVEFTGITEGTWGISAQASKPGGGPRSFVVPQVVISAGNPHEDIELKEGRPATIAGHVDLRDFGPGPLYVIAYTPSGLFWNQTLVADDGSYQLDNMQAGGYQVVLHSGNAVNGDAYVEESGERREIDPMRVWWAGDVDDQSSDPADAATIELEEDETRANIDFVAVPGGTVRARVALADGSGSAALPAYRCVTLTAYRLVGSSWIEEPAGSDWACGTEPLVARGLPDGDYRFELKDDHTGSTAWSTVYNGGATSFGAATPVEVEGGETVDLGTLVVRFPEPDDASLEALDLDFLEGSGLDLTAYEDQVSTDDDLEEGGDATVQVGSDLAGQWVNVSLNSTPIVVGDSWQQVAADGSVTVVIPDGVAGSHRLAVGDSAGRLIGWTSVEIAEGATAEAPTGGSTTGPAKPTKSAAKPAGSSSAVVVTPPPEPTASPTPIATDEPETSPSADPEPTASDDAPASDSGWILWVVGGGLVVLVGAAAVLIFRRRLV